MTWIRLQITLTTIPMRQARDCQLVLTAREELKDGVISWRQQVFHTEAHF